MANSYNGWVASPSAAAIGIDTGFSAAGVAFPGGVKSGPVSVVFRYLIERLDAEVEACHPGWCWGYEYRANVNNPSTLSCHASGTAIDYNAPNHGNGTSVGPNGGGGWSAAQYRKIQGILQDLEGVVRWLTSNDPMHFEIGASAAAVALVAAKISGGSNIGTGPDKPPATTTPDDTGDWFDMATAADLDAAIDRAIPKIIKGVWENYFLVTFTGSGASMGDILNAVYSLNPDIKEIKLRLRGGDSGPGQEHEKIDMLQGINAKVTDITTQVWDNHFEDVNGDLPDGGASMGDIVNATYSEVQRIPKA